MTPAERVLLACAASGDAPGVPESIREAMAADGVDWPDLALRSVRHGVAQLVALRLREMAGQYTAPPEVTDWFAGALAANAVRNAVLLRHLGQVAERLVAAGIPYRVLKGAGLSVTVYRDPAHRNFSDLDLLVPEERMRDADALLGSMGFVREERADSDRSVEEVFYQDADRDILTGTIATGFGHGPAAVDIARYARRVTLELHRGLLRDATGRYRRTDLGAVWNRSRTAFLPDGSQVDIPSPEAMLAHLAAHAQDHGFDRLLYFVDLAACVHSYCEEVDWSETARLASDWDSAHALCRMLLFLRDSFRVEVPKQALVQLEPYCDRPITERRVFAMAEAGMDGRTFARLSAARGISGRLLPALRAVFPPRRVMEEQYGRHPLGLARAYATRPFSLVLRGARTLVRRT